MKFTCSTEINAPVEKVVNTFEDLSKRKDWQPGFVSRELISGNPDKAGAKYKIVFNGKRGDVVMTETILVSDLPREMKGVYEHPHMSNTMANRFTAVGPDRTKYETEIHYTRFTGFIPKLMSLFMSGMFKKQTQKMMEQFKAIAEGNK